jgi:2-succinyl-6-hydroxy-2,4-cyclohexadiene-1-carboxylate synthase
VSLVEIDGLRLHVERRGNGPPVVLLHGFTGDVSTWDALSDALEPEFTTLAVDLIGHGLSDAPEAVDRYRMRGAVDDLAALLHAQGFDRAAWLGYSLGGRVALQVAVHRPDVVSALILEGASPGLASEDERTARIEADEGLSRMLEEQGIEAFVDHWQALPLWDPQAHTLTDEQSARIRAQRLSQRPHGLAGSLRGMGTGSQEWMGDRLHQVRVPVLLTAGSLDSRYVAIAREMTAALPDATLRLIDGAGHAAHLERPAQFEQAVIEFLRGVRERL